MNNKEKIINNVIENLKICYDEEQRKLGIIGKEHKTEGQIRQAAGELVEHILQNIFDTLNSHLKHNKVISKVGATDFLSKFVIYKGKKYEFNTIQVDRHIWFKKKRIAFIENKTYLDSCYYDRALADFRKIAQSLHQKGKDPGDVQYIVFAGQKAAKDDTLLNYTIDFYEDTKHLTKYDDGLSVNVFYFLQGIRNSSRPLYKIKHPLNDSEIKRFLSLILSIVEK